MTDVVSPAVRSRIMAAVRGKDTRPEWALRHALHRRGIRYRLHQKRLPGRPDLVFPRFNAVCLVHGCFWHRHEGCRYATTPATRRRFWREKFAANVARDERNHRALRAAGWRVATVWECALGKDRAETVARRLDGWLRGEEVEFESDEWFAPVPRARRAAGS